jgi:hypothetical protein
MSNQSAEAQTVANALSGEKAFETVRFAVTGNENADALAGIQAVLAKIPLNRNSPMPHARYAAMLLKYLAECYAAEATAQEEQAKRHRNIMGTIPGAMVDPAYPEQPYPGWTTTGGTSGPGSFAHSGPPVFSPTKEEILEKIHSQVLREEKEKRETRESLLADLMKKPLPPT